MALNLDRAVGERILIKDEHDNGCWLTVTDMWEDRHGRMKVRLSFDGDRTAFQFAREELLGRDDLPRGHA